MMKPKDMFKVTVFGPKTYMKDIIDTLYEMNVVHIEEHTKKTEEEFFDIGEPFETNEKYAGQLVKLRTLISNLDIAKVPVKRSESSLKVIEEQTEKIYERATELLSKKDYLERVKKIYDQKRIQKSLDLLKIDKEEEVDYKKLVHFFGYVDAKQEDIKEEIEKITKKYIIYTVNYEGITLMALFADKGEKKSVKKLLDTYDYSPIDNPIIENNFELESKPGNKYIEFDHEKEVVEKKLNKVNRELEGIKQDNKDFILETEKRLKIETDKAEAPLKFATSKNTFLIKGWVPKENQSKLTEKLNDITKGRVMVEYDKPKKGEDVPIAFDNPKIVRPFESFMELYTLPSYTEIDPTFFLFLTFPIFFGFMLGDAGYGLVTLILFSVLKNKMPGARKMLNAFIVASISSIIFGIIYGEYFGFETLPPVIGEALGMQPEAITSHGETNIVYNIPRLFSRSHGNPIQNLLSMSLIFGMVHLLVGYIIGFINIYRHHGFKHAFMEKGGWMLLYPAVLWLLTDFLGVISGFVEPLIRPLILPMPAIIITGVAGIIVIIMGEGAQGAVELPALISNILSYARLMAVGLASLSLAVVVNDLATEMFHSGAVGIFAGILILMLGHTINIALGILSPFLHSIRLHYVEFFTKFFQGGGKKYTSFGED